MTISSSSQDHERVTRQEYLNIIRCSLRSLFAWPNIHFISCQKSLRNPHKNDIKLETQQCQCHSYQMSSLIYHFVHYRNLIIFISLPHHSSQTSPVRVPITPLISFTSSPSLSPPPCPRYFTIQPMSNVIISRSSHQVAWQYAWMSSVCVILPSGLWPCDMMDSTLIAGDENYLMRLRN